MGIIRALETCPFGRDLAVEVRTDSKYCIDCECDGRAEGRVGVKWCAGEVGEVGELDAR